MLQQIFNEVTPVLATVISAILIVIIKKVGDAAVDYISEKKKYVIANTTQQERDNLISIGKCVWNIVEEHFRLSDTVTEFAETKIDMFNRLLLKKVPGLTQAQIDSVRQAIAGEVNKGKEVIVTDEVLANTNLKLQQENASLTVENADLKKQLEQIQTLVTGKAKEPTT